MKNYDGVRDHVLERDAYERLACDRRLAHLDLDIRADGGVLHVEGEVGNEGEARLLRRVLAQLRGVLAVWDLVRCAHGAPPRVIDIGCGGCKQKPEAIGVDRHAGGGVDLVTDLEALLPIADRSVDHIFAVHVLEHIQDVFTLMDELHRVLKPSGVLHVMVPFWRHANAVADPTHVRFFAPETFKHFCEPTQRRPWEPVALTTVHDTVFADLEPVAEDHSVPFEEIVARFFLYLT